MDVFSTAQRSEIMRRVPSRDTKPERLVRSVVSRMGFRYRLHSKHIQGCPDLVFRRLHKVIFVHGCFWHGHNCKAGALPSSNIDYWKAKIGRNVSRDKRTQRALHRQGWNALVVWECAAKSDKTRERIRRFLNG
ncbi:MAG: very short patch repair endonuclease [Terriglobia bacterium]